MHNRVKHICTTELENAKKVKIYFHLKLNNTRAMLNYSKWQHYINNMLFNAINVTRGTNRTYYKLTRHSWVSSRMRIYIRRLWRLSFCTGNFYSYHNKQQICRPLTGLWCYLVIDSAPRLGVYYFLSLTLSVCMSVCMSWCSFKLLLLFCFSMELSHFLDISSPCGTLQNRFVRFLI